MKGKWLKVFAVLTCLSLSAGIVACGGTDNKEQGATGNSSFAIGGGEEEISSEVESESESSEISSEVESESESSEISSEIESESSEISSKVESENESSEISSEVESESESVEDTDEAVELVYALNQAGDGYTVTGYNGAPSELIIPSTYESLPVTGIGADAFYDCDTLTSVSIPDSVTAISGQAFRNCDVLAQIDVGNGVSTIERYAIYECPALVNIVVDENNATYQSIDGNLYSKDGTKLLVYAGGKTETSFAIPDTVTEIGDDAFAYCSTLTNVALTKNVTKIGYWAFAYCTGLTEIVIPNSVSTMRDYVFYGCSNLTIYCEAASKPFTWGKWNFTQCPVIWGYTAEE
ncbi:MAG: leucine-rich repeat domain-containing protein [Clostridia bacterium]|nr:leucine-rich repeat domain-containing protein [Clostridia bacterium]